MRPFAPLALVVLAACQSNDKPAPDSPTSSTAQNVRVAPPASGSSAPMMPSAKITVMPPPVTMPATAAELGKSSNALGFDLFGRVGPGNVSIGPASISIALAMALDGAKAETATQMKKTMHLEGDKSDDWGKIAASLQDPNRGGQLSIVNRLFGEKTYKFEDPFLQRTSAAFGAPTEPLDFVNDKDGSRKHINDWVFDQTKQKIKDLIPDNGVTSLTRMVLVNAMYFLGDWETPFEKERTHDDAFSVAPGKTSQVPMMNLTEHFSAGSIDGAKVVILPYKGNVMSMTLIVPDKVDGLAAIEKTLSNDTMAKVDKAATSQNTSVSMPRFTIDPPSSFELKEALLKLGMTNAFDKDKADFTAMASPPKKDDRLYIGKVFHKAFVKVDEKGTEAAAATAVVMAKGGGMPGKAFEVKADRPFLFIVRDRATGIVLFMGRVADPKG